MKSFCTIIELGETRYVRHACNDKCGAVLVCAPDGDKLTSEQAALGLIGEALQTRARLVIVPVDDLRTISSNLRQG